MNKTKYAIGDQLTLVDLNGKVYRVYIGTITTYTVAHQLGNIEILAQQYPPPDDTVDTTTTLFYICSNVPQDTQEFNNLILWDSIIDHSKTVYLTEKVVYRLDILPLPPISGQPAKDINEIINTMKNVIATQIPEVQIQYTNITNTADNTFEIMKAAADKALAFFDEIKELESIRPLIADLRSIDFKNLTTETMNYIASIQARLSLIDAGGSAGATQG